MPVKTKKISIDFGLGVDEFTDRKLVKEGKLLKAENISFTKAKTIAKRNGFSPLSNLDISGEIIQEPKKICSFREKPVIFSDEKVYNKIDTEYQSNAVAWRDSKNFHFPTHVDTDGIMQLNDEDYSQANTKDFVFGSAVLDEHNVKCTVVGSHTVVGLKILVEDYSKNEVLHESIIGGSASDDVFFSSSVRVIPFKSFGGEPDRFMIFYQELGWEYDALKPTVLSSFRLATVRLNSMTEVSVTEEGDMFNFFSLVQYPEFTNYLSAPSLNPTRYFYDFDVIYEEETSKIFFVFCAEYDLPAPATRRIQRIVFFRAEQAFGTTMFLGRYLGYQEWYAPTPDPTEGWWESEKHFRVSLTKKIAAAPEPKLACAAYILAEVPPLSIGQEFRIQGFDITSTPPPLPPVGPGQFSNYTLKRGDPLFPDLITSETFPRTYRCMEIKYHEPDLVSYGGSEKKHLFLSFAQPDINIILQNPAINSGRRGYTSYSYIFALDLANTPTPIVGMKDIDILPFAKIAASPVNFNYGGDAPNVSNNYLVLPIYKKRNLIQYAGDRFGDVYLMSYNVGIGKEAIPSSQIKGHCIAKTLSGSAYGSLQDPAMSPDAFLDEDNIIFDTISYSSIDEISVSRCNIELGADFEAVEVGNSLYTSGGFLKVFNGRSYVENNFHFPPIIESIEFSSNLPEGFFGFKKTIANSNGTNETVFDDLEESDHAAYQFVFCYEWTDENGTIHRSAPSEVVFGRLKDEEEITVTERVTFNIDSYPATMTEKNNVLLKGYRTLNLTGEQAPGTPGEFFYDGSTKISGLEDAGFSIQTENLMIPYAFRRSDSAIGMNDTLYTSKGELANIPPPPVQDIGIHDGRLFALSSENPNRIFYSKPSIQRTSLEFSDELYLNSMEQGGDVKAIGSIMGKLFMFKENLIAVSYGSPKNEKGENGGYSASSTYTHTMGCSNPRSVISTGNGLYFQFGGDLYMIDRSLQVKWVGAPVDDSDDIDIIAAIHVGDSDEIRFMSREHTLVFNVLFKQWSKFTNRAVSAALVRGVLHYINIGGELSEVLYEDKSSYGDSDVPVLTDIETAWINLAGPQGFQRLRNILFLGELYQDTTFDIQLFYDYNRYPSETITVNASDIASLEVFGGEVTWGAPTPDGYAYFGGTNLDHIFQFRLKPKIQKCESIKIKIVEPPRLSVTKGYALNNMTLEIASKKSAYKLKESKTI